MATKTEILFFLILFYTILGVFAGIVGSYFNDEITYTTDGVNTVDVSYDSETTKSIGGFSFNKMITGFSSLGTEFNVAFFGSFTLLFSWIIISSLPTFNGGG